MTTYLLTVRPLSVKRFSSFFELYDATMNVFNSIVREVNADVLAFRFSDDPYYHIHAVISVKGRIRYDHVHEIVPKGFHVHLAPLRKKSDVEDAIEYVLRHRPVSIVHADESIAVIKRDGKNIREVKDMSDVEKRLERLEKTVERIVETLEKLASGKTSEADGKTKMESVEIKAGAMTVIVQESRKGVALRIRFRSFVKPNNKGEYYIALTSNEYKQLIAGLQSFDVSETNANSNTDTNTNGKSGRKSGKRSGTRIKSKRGGEL